MRYLGRLSTNDPLHAYLQGSIFPQITHIHGHTEFRVFQFPASNEVYLYEEAKTRQRVIGKFYSQHGKDPALLWPRAENEFHHLEYIRSIGFTGRPHAVPKALGCNQGINNILVETFSPGCSLSAVIEQSIRDHQADILFAKLTALAYFLAKMHNLTARSERVNFAGHEAYFAKIIARLLRRNRVSAAQALTFHHDYEGWRQEGAMWSDCAVMVHGDATPSNLLFGDGLLVTAIDLERMHPADRAYDLGMVAGELQHSFLRHTHRKDLAEPFIGHFLWEYACHFPDRHAAFAAITQRIPFYMGLTLLRIARNSWLDWHYSQVLVHEAHKTLRR